MDSARNSALALGLAALVAAPVARADGAGNTGSSSAAIVYGVDDRRDYYEVEDPAWQRRIAQSVGTFMTSRELDASDPDDQRPSGPTLQQAMRVCADERFSQQPTVGQCSATLIDDRLVLTAGHCVADGRWRDWRFVFGFYYEAPGRLARIGRDDVYRVTRVVLSEYSRRADHAIVELDRPVVNHSPAPVRRAPPELRERVVVLGFPSTIPCKYDDGGTINQVGNGFFTADVDTFAGNSGSGIWSDDGSVIGILSAGGQDYTFDRARGCLVANVVPPCNRAGCGETIARADLAVEALCARGYDSPRLCGPAVCGDGVCAGDERESCPSDCPAVPDDAGAGADASAADASVAADASGADTLGGGDDGGAAVPAAAGCACALATPRGQRGGSSGAALVGVGALAAVLARGRRRMLRARVDAPTIFS